jgi:hypothetical protein
MLLWLQGGQALLIQQLLLESPVRDASFKPLQRGERWQVRHLLQ